MWGSRPKALELKVCAEVLPGREPFHAMQPEHVGFDQANADTQAKEATTRTTSAAARTISSRRSAWASRSAS